MVIIQLNALKCAQVNAKFLNFPLLDNVLKILQGFESVSLEELDRVALLDRHDTKYVMPRVELDPILRSLTSEYKVLEVNGFRMTPYESLYFDTEELEFYDLHQRGKRNRLKIRMRKYCSTNVTFLETKFKTNKNRTVKYRKEIEDIRHTLSSDDLQFIRDDFGDMPDLQPRLYNTFKRITLANLDTLERLTIDLDLRFDNLNGHTIDMEDLVIVELKQVDFNRESIFARTAKKRMIRPDSVSKYCLGVGLLYESVKKNFINVKLRRIQKLGIGN